MTDDVSLMQHATAALAFELAAQLVPWRQVIARFGLSEDQLKSLLASPQFQSLVRDAKAKWESPMSVAERTRLKAQFSIEQCLLPLHGIVQDPRSGAQSRIDAAKLLASIAGLSRGEAAAPDSGRFSLTINLGDHTARLEQGPPVTIHDEASS